MKISVEREYEVDVEALAGEYSHAGEPDEEFVDQLISDYGEEIFESPWITLVFDDYSVYDD